jgi:DNA-binding IclR family transcriptional regulator
MTSATHATKEFADLVTRVRAEFLEMPGMCLTLTQAARLWELSPDAAEALLAELVVSGFLVRPDRNHYQLPSPA